MRTDIQVFAPPTQFFISPSGNATIGGIPAQGADVLLYDKPSNTWTMAVSYTHLTLPTSDLSVDLGGRRIIKKKKNKAERGLSRLQIINNR